MSSINASARRDAASTSIQQLRLRFLDLTVRNPLINFDHGSRANVRAIDVGMEGIYPRLIELGNRFRGQPPTRRDTTFINDLGGACLEP